MGAHWRGCRLPFERVQASDVTRAAETCDIIVQELERLRPWEVELNQLFREGAPIQPDPPHPTWQPSEDDFFREGARMEAVRCAAARMVAAAHSRAQGFRDLFRRPVDLESAGPDGGAPRRGLAEAHRARAENSYELVVCHGNVIRYWCMRALQLEPQAWLRLSHANCGVRPPTPVSTAFATHTAVG